MKDMKKCYLDANTLLYWQDSFAPFNQEAKKLIEKLIEKGYQLFFSPLILDEYIHNSVRFSGKRIAEAKKGLNRSLKRIFSLPKLQLVNPPLLPQAHLKVVYFMAKYNLHARDAYHLFIMKENKIKYFATFDNDFDSVFAKRILRKFT